MTAFARARDFLQQHRHDYAAAMRGFEWPAVTEFNWARDYFDHIADGNDARALWVIHEDGSEDMRTFSEMSRRSNQVARMLMALGIRRGDRLLLMLGNEAPLWETLLACIKLGAVVIPATTALTPDDIRDRFDRGDVKHVVASAACTDKFETVKTAFTRIVVGGSAPHWTDFAEADRADASGLPAGRTMADDPMLLYFTSGTTAVPKLVLHTHRSYPVGHLSTMYWIGVQKGDLHWNISSPGWAKHAWSCVFAPWNAGATTFVFNYRRFDPLAVLDVLTRYRITTLCAPPTVWRMLIQEPLANYRTSLREVVSAGEPLNPEVIDRVKDAWRLEIRDGYGQTETTALIGNSPGQHLKPGSMGRPLPGYDIEIVDVDGRAADEGEVCVSLAGPRGGLMAGYADDVTRTEAVMRSGRYHTGDIATRDTDGYITFVGRTDDVFKASDYRISPFEIESVLIQHPAIAEAAVVPSPDPIRHAVPKAFVTLAPAFQPSRDVARDIFRHVRQTLAPYKRIRRLEFCDLPKTISGKIRRVDLRKIEQQQRASGVRSTQEFLDEDFTDNPEAGMGQKSV